VIDEWIVWLKSPKKMASYQVTRKDFSREYECLNAILSWYRGEFDRAQLVLPFKRRHIEKLKSKRSNCDSKRFMSDEESQLWLDTLKIDSPEVYPAAIVQIEQILRVSEVFGMTWSKLNLDRKTYKLCQSVEWLRTPGVRPRLKDGTKVLLPGGYLTLQLRQAAIDELKSVPKKADCDLIFHKNGNLWTYREVQSRYDRAFKLAKLPYRGTHICRHTGATKFLNETGDELALTSMGGWTTTEQARHYGKMLGLTVREAIDRADQLRESKKKN